MMLQSAKKIIRADPEKFSKVENFTEPHTHTQTN